jgi:hypothetical protein
MSYSPPVYLLVVLVSFNFTLLNCGLFSLCPFSRLHFEESTAKCLQFYLLSNVKDGSGIIPYLSGTSSRCPDQKFGGLQLLDKAHVWSRLPDAPWTTVMQAGATPVGTIFGMNAASITIMS